MKTFFIKYHIRNRRPRIFNVQLKLEVKTSVSSKLHLEDNPEFLLD